jgi:hypothetical protein
MCKKRSLFGKIFSGSKGYLKVIKTPEERSFCPRCQAKEAIRDAEMRRAETRRKAQLQQGDSYTQATFISEESNTAVLEFPQSQQQQQQRQRDSYIPPGLLQEFYNMPSAYLPDESRPSALDFPPRQRPETRRKPLPLKLSSLPDKSKSWGTHEPPRTSSPVSPVSPLSETEYRWGADSPTLSTPDREIHQSPTTSSPVPLISPIAETGDSWSTEIRNHMKDITDFLGVKEM